MGADLILMSIPRFDPTFARKRQLARFLINQPEADLLGFAEDYCLLDDVNPEATPRQKANIIRKKLYDDVLESLKCEGNRDTCNLRFYKMPYEVLISGGMSWGDNPTDACDTMQHVNAYGPLWEFLMQLAIEDCQNAAQEEENTGH